MNKERYLLSIKAENRPGLLHLVTGIIEKKLIAIQSVSAAPTDIHDIIMITIEVYITERDLMTLALKLENIIEVFAVEAIKYDKTLCLRAAYFKMEKLFLESPKVSVLQEHGAVIVNWYPDAFLLAKYGTDAAILNLYNQLDGPHLLGFSQTGLITDTLLIDNDESSVISRAA